MRNHQAVIDTANETINFPDFRITLAMTDEMKNCNLKQLQILSEEHQIRTPQQTTTSKAIVATTNTNDVTGTNQRRTTTTKIRRNGKHNGCTSDGNSTQ